MALARYVSCFPACARGTRHVHRSRPFTTVPSATSRSVFPAAAWQAISAYRRLPVRLGATARSTVKNFPARGREGVVVSPTNFMVPPVTLRADPGSAGMT